MIPDYAKRLVFKYLYPPTEQATFAAMGVAENMNRGAILKKIIDWVCQNEKNYQDPKKRHIAERYLINAVFWTSLTYEQLRKELYCIGCDKTVGRHIKELEKMGLIYSNSKYRRWNHIEKKYTINFVNLAKALQEKVLKESNKQDKLSYYEEPSVTGQSVPLVEPNNGTKCPISKPDKVSYSNNNLSNDQSCASLSASPSHPLGGATFTPTASLSPEQQSENTTTHKTEVPPTPTNSNGLLEPKLFKVKLSELVPQEKKHNPEAFKDDEFEVTPQIKESMEETFRKPYTRWCACSNSAYRSGIEAPHNGKIKRLIAFASCESNNSDWGSYFWLEDGTLVRGQDLIKGTSDTYSYHFQLKAMSFGLTA